MTKKTIFAGFGGQGVLLMGYVTALAAMIEDKHVTYLPSYGAEVRGGTANCTVVVSNEEIFSPVASAPDYAVIMNKPSLARFEGTICGGGRIVLNSSLVNRNPVREDIHLLKVPANDLAHEMGSDRTINMIMLGAFVAWTNITRAASILQGLEEITKGKKADLMALNHRGLDRGAAYALQGV